MQTEMLAQARWECVHFTTKAEIGMLRESLPGHFVAEVRGKDIANQEVFFGALAAAFHFPDYFGANWDAVEECLSDLDWLQSAGCILVISGATQLWHAIPHSLGILIEIWLAVASKGSIASRPCHLVFEW